MPKHELNDPAFVPQWDNQDDDFSGSVLLSDLHLVVYSPITWYR